MRKRISLSLPEDLIEILNREADKQIRDLSNFCEYVFRDYLSKDKNGKMVPPKRSRIFEPPDLSEATSYFHERGCTDYQNQAECFIDHFTSNGWMVGGKTKMKDWKAAIRNWLKRSNNNAVNQGHNRKLSAAERVEQACFGEPPTPQHYEGVVGQNGQDICQQVDNELWGNTSGRVDNGTQRLLLRDDND